MISQIASFCEHCGTQLVSATTKFCQSCGKPVVSAAGLASIIGSAAGGSAAGGSAAGGSAAGGSAAGGSAAAGSAAAPVLTPVNAAPVNAPSAAIEPAVGSTAEYSAGNLENYTLMKQIYNQAAQVEPVQRDAYLVQACQGDAALLHELRSMFVTEAGSLTGRPVPQAQQNVPQSVSAVASTPQAYMIGAYRLLRELGRGGMGVVYLAVRDDGTFRKNVALKLLLSDRVNPEFVSRFQQERQMLAALEHPNIARILDGGDTQDRMPFYVMEYVEGLPLDKYCDQQRLSLSGRLKIFQQVCLAVDYLHQNSILHRDLKPSNILVSSEGVVKLLDFGIAKVVGAGAFANPDLTSAQGRPMTPTYASPEQISGATLSKTSDLYSLGAILYTLLTGRSAYNDLDDKLAKIEAREMPTKPSTNIREDLRSAETTAQFRRAMMGELDSIVLMAMQIDPRNRYQSAADLQRDIQRFLDGMPVTAFHSSAAGRSVKLLKRKSTLIAVLCAFLALAAFGVWEWTRLEHQKSEAAANYNRLNGLIDELQNRVDKMSVASPSPVSPALPSVLPVSTALPMDDDVVRFKAAFEKYFANAPDHDALLAKGIKYLDSVRAVAPADPKLSVQVGNAYQQLGDLQEKGAKTGKAALTTYEKAATTLASADGTKQTKQDLAIVNARIKALGGAPLTIPETPVQPPAESPVVETPVAKVTPVARPHVITNQTPLPPTPVATVAEKPAISAETEDELIAVTSKVEIADQSLVPIRQNLERDGQTLNADTMTKIARMHASLDRAKRAVAAGNESDAKESLGAADALATKLMRTVGR